MHQTARWYFQVSIEHDSMQSAMNHLMIHAFSMHVGIHISGGNATPAAKPSSLCPFPLCTDRSLGQGVAVCALFAARQQARRVRFCRCRRLWPSSLRPRPKVGCVSYAWVLKQRLCRGRGLPPVSSPQEKGGSSCSTTTTPAYSPICAYPDGLVVGNGEE